MNNKPDFNDDFLSRATVEKITGCKHSSGQCLQLRKNSTHHIVDRNGMPWVTKFSIDNPLYLRQGEGLAHNEQPDFSAMD